MNKIIKTEQEMISFAKSFAKDISVPSLIELVGDVGAGKTTFTRGLAEGLGISEPVTSPSFSISKYYAFRRNNQPCTLVHYDFYRLPDPGLMAEDLSESINSPDTITVVEWADSVVDLLPADRITITITQNPDTTRTITVSQKA